jgi:hypothetical protein
LLVHFHGHPATVEREILTAGIDAALVVVNFPGLSSAYRRPLSNEALFGAILANAEAELRTCGSLAAEGKLDRVFVSSFSAGFGAVRKILTVPKYFDRIDGYLAADSIYAGLAETKGQEGIRQRRELPTESAAPRPVNSTNMCDFRRFARLAADRKKTFIVTHSQLFTPQYASTVDTAEDLLRHVGVARKQSPENASGSGKPMQLVTRAEMGRFVVLSYAGEDGDAHMQHLRQMGRWLPILVRPRHDSNGQRGIP